ncbi:MAG: hypothetical protein NT027_14045 [Proteobacteria bacterium]|nr:hypothetical protein [Pseudomonadota bacterium]
MFFVLGYFLISDERIEQAIAQFWKLHLGLAIVFTIFFFALRTLSIPEESISYWILYGAKGIVYRCCSWTWILAFLGAGQRFLNRKFS